MGFSRTGDNGRVTANLYHTTIKNLITNRRSVENVDGVDRDVYTPVNIDESRIIGVEFSGTTRINDWNLTGTLTWQDAQNRSAGRKGEPLLKRPRKKLDLDFSRRFGKHLFGANIFAQGQSEDFGNVDLAGFALVNLRGDIRIERNWSLGLKVNNLFDKDYETAADYPQDGINFMATLRYVADGGR